MLHTFPFSLQNTVYFIMLPFDIYMSKGTTLSYDVEHRSQIVTSELVRLVFALTLEHVT
jgi:hypothetical protein